MKKIIGFITLLTILSMLMTACNLRTIFSYPTGAGIGDIGGTLSAAATSQSAQTGAVTAGRDMRPRLTALRAQNELRNPIREPVSTGSRSLMDHQGVRHPIRVISSPEGAHCLIEPG